MSKPQNERFHKERVVKGRPKDMSSSDIRRQKNERASQCSKERQKQRREEAAQRDLAYSLLSPGQRIEQLDARLGKGIGAKKERRRLEQLLQQY